MYFAHTNAVDNLVIFAPLVLILDLCAVRSYVELRADSGIDAVFDNRQLHIIYLAL
jgi:hypothetical protein